MSGPTLTRAFTPRPLPPATHHRALRLIFLSATLSLLLPFPNQAHARSGNSSGGNHGRPGGRSATQTQLLENRYRPRVYFVAPKSGENIETRQPIVPLVIEYVVQAGYLGEVFLFVDNRKAATYQIPNKQKKGRIEVTLDLAKYGPGTYSLRLGGSQGAPGKRSLTKQQAFSTKVTYRP